MLRVFKTSDDGTLEKLKNIETNTWIDLVEPTEEEIKEVVEKTDIPANLLIKLLDSDEVARIEKEDDATLIIIDVPYVIDKKIKNKYSTLPLGIISYKNYLVTIAVKETEVVQDVMENRVKSVFTMKKSRFLIQILHRVATLYLKYLKEINLEIEAKERTEGTLGFWWCGRYGMHSWPMEIEKIDKDFEKYESVTICSPVWVFGPAAPIREFLTENKGKIKKMRVVITHFQFCSMKSVIKKIEEIAGIKAEEKRSVGTRIGKIREEYII